MAVAETSVVQDRTPAGPHAALGWKSLLGAAYVLLSVGIVLTGLPLLWNRFVAHLLNNEFLSGALLILVTLGVGTGLFFVGRNLERASAQAGSRAGAVFLCAYVLFLLWILSWLGSALGQLEVIGAVLTLGLIGGLAFFAFRLFHKPGFCQWLIEVEEQGWFHATAYKANQGVRVRRGTVIALLVLGISGIITLVSHGTLGSGRLGSNDWYIWIPFVGDETTGYTIPLLFSVHYTLPLILVGLTIWFAWRVTNWPTFADFLIATEAEMNKVSWTPRKRLVQDTVVVLVTVLILTVFLFVVDFMWIRILESPFINVLQLNIKEVQQKQLEKAQW